MAVTVQTLSCCCNCCKRLPDTINFNLFLHYEYEDPDPADPDLSCTINHSQILPLVKETGCQKNVETCCWRWSGTLDCGDEFSIELCCDPDFGDTSDAITITYSLPCAGSGLLSIIDPCDCADIEECTTQLVLGLDMHLCECCEDDGPVDPDPPPSCCSEGNASGTLHCDLSSACAAYNGITFDLEYNGSQWEGFVDTGDFCGSPCRAFFIFSCVSLEEEEETFEWRITAGAIGEHVGCDEDGDEDCAPTGFRRANAPTTCSPLDLTMTTGTLVVKTQCSCCSNVAITARVYE